MSTTDPDRATVIRLQQIANVGPAISGDLVPLGVASLDDVSGRDPDTLYHALCRLDTVCPDPCMADVLTAIVAIANGEKPRSWWSFTPARKSRWTPITPPRPVADGP